MTNKPIELKLEIETYTIGLSFSLFEAKEIHSGQTQKTIGEGVTILSEGGLVREAVAVPSIIYATAYIGEHVVLPIAIGLLSRYLYDKLKERKDNKLRINGTQVEINAEKIEQLVIVILNEKRRNKN